MGLLPFNKNLTKPHAEDAAVAKDEAPKFERVVWYQDAGLRVLYWHCFILCMSR